MESHADKQAAAGTCKGGFGFHPLMAYLDATGECPAGVGRPGNAGSNTAKLSDDWPWTPHLLTAFQRVHNLPLLI